VTPLLEIRDLRVRFGTEAGALTAVDGVSCTVPPRGTLGIVGESGSGKTVMSLAVMGLTRFTGAQVSGEVVFEGRNLLTLPDDELRRVRGSQIAMIFQDPLSSLHPLMRVGTQLVEAIRAHSRVTRRAARARAVELLRMVELPDPARRVRAYPHELSGGMRQRAMIAMALANEPRLLIADEPTTALDVTVQAQILELLKRLQDELGMATMIITHDLGVIAETADEVAVMYAGRIVERAPTRTLFSAPEHPYTWGLLRSLPRLDVSRGEPLVPIEGRPPSLVVRPSGCSFHPRCPYRQPAHERIDPALEPVPGDAGHEVACLLDPDRRREIWREIAPR
jgi:peptide/nickel transport system ATP-binding protein